MRIEYGMFDNSDGLKQSDSWLIERFITGQSYNINTIVSANGHATFEPSEQVLGHHLEEVNPFAFCGNSFDTTSMDVGLRDEILFQSRMIARKTSELGYRGCLGIDFVHDGTTGDLYPCEINPRLQNSTFLIDWLDSERKAPSPLLLHLRACRGEEVGGHMAVPSGGQLIVHTREQFQATTSVQDGWTSQHDAVGRGHVPAHACDIGYVTGAPEEGTTLMPGSVIFRLFFSSGLLKEASQVDSRARRVADQLFQKISLGSLGND